MRKKLRIGLTGLITSLISINAHATAFQSWAGISYSNPAMLNSVKKAEVIIGNTTYILDLKFTGQSGPNYGTVRSRETENLPYGRLAYRVHPKFVVGIDVNQNTFTEIHMPTDSIISFAATDAVLRSTDYSPRFSYQATDKLALGLGLDIYHFWESRLAFVVPPNGKFDMDLHNWSYGFNAGLFYTFTPCTFLNLFYYSQVENHQHGKTTWGPVQNTHTEADLPFPATYVANLIQMLNPKWALSGTVRWGNWSSNRFLTIQNTPLGTVLIPDHYIDSWNFILATRYQFTEKFAGFGALEYDSKVQDIKDRQVGYPVYDMKVIGLGGEYNFTKEWKAKLTLGHVWSDPGINMGVIPIVGNSKLRAYMIDLNISYDI